MSFEDSYGTPHTYRGDDYDSWTEAVWAAYFDVAKMPYEHEPCTFEYPSYTQSDGETYIPTSFYTPDFFLPEQDCFVDIKNGNAKQEFGKIARLAKDIGKATLLLDGKPWNAAAYFYSPDSNYSDIYQNPLESTVQGHSFGSSRFPLLNNRGLTAYIQKLYSQTVDLDRTALRPSTNEEIGAHRDKKAELRENTIIIPRKT